jgi:hypothetical protein
VDPFFALKKSSPVFEIDEGRRNKGYCASISNRNIKQAMPTCDAAFAALHLLRAFQPDLRKPMIERHERTPG